MRTISVKTSKKWMKIDKNNFRVRHIVKFDNAKKIY